MNQNNLNQQILYYPLELNLFLFSKDHIVHLTFMRTSRKAKKKKEMQFVRRNETVK